MVGSACCGLENSGRSIATSKTTHMPAWRRETLLKGSHHATLARKLAMDCVLSKSASAAGMLLVPVLLNTLAIRHFDASLLIPCVLARGNKCRD